MLDVFIAILVIFLFCQQQAKRALGKSLQELWPGYPSLCPAFPAAPRGTEQWAPAPSPRRPFHAWAANPCVQTQHQLHFLSPDCLELPENFLWSKRIRMPTVVSLLPPAPGLQNNSISTIWKKNLYNGGTLLFPARTPDEFAPRAGSGNQIFDFIKMVYWAEQRRVWGEREA